MDRNDFIEQILGGIFAIIAMVAAFWEMLINGISSATVAACIKDIFGMLVIAVLFFAIMKDRLPKTNFRAAFNQKMEPIMEKYNPLIREEVLNNSETQEESKQAQAKKDKLEKVICYEIANTINVLFGVEAKGYHRFLEIESKETTTAKFLVRKKFFNYENFSEALLDDIAKKIKSNLEVKFPEYKFSISKGTSGPNIDVDFNIIMKSNRDAAKVVALVDSAVMLYIAESRK